MMLPTRTATHGSHRFWVIRLCACAALLGGCDEAYVVPTQTMSEQLPKPDRVLVYNFAVTHEDVMLDRGIGPEIVRDLGNSDQTDEEVRVGRIVTSALAENLVKDLRTGGIQAYRASDAPPPSRTTVSIKGQFVRVDQGNRTVRLLVGFGFGGPLLQTLIQVYQGAGSEARLIGEAETATETGMKPGLGLMIPFGVVAGMLDKAASVSGTTTATSEAFFTTVEGDAKRTAKEAARHVAEYYRRHGWIAP